MAGVMTGVKQRFSLPGKLTLLHGCLAVALRQAVHVGARKPTSPAVDRLVDALSEVLKPVDPDRPLDMDVRAGAEALDRLEGQLS